MVQVVSSLRPRSGSSWLRQVGTWVLVLGNLFGVWIWLVEQLDEQQQQLILSEAPFSSTTAVAANKNITNEPKCLLVFNNGGSQPRPGDDKCLLDVGTSPYIDLLLKTMVGVPLGGSYNPTNVGKLLKYNDRQRTYAQDYPPFGYTMIGKRRMDNLRASIEEVNRNGIEGDIVELGVWRGGAMMFAAGVGQESNHQRDIHLFDAFGTIDEYNSDGHGDVKKRDFLSVPLNEVQEAFEYFNLDGPHIHYHVGLFKDTVPKWKKEYPNRAIAVLRIDGNFYDSYQDAFYYLYENVPIGGIVILDDLSSYQPAVLRFWQDFVKDQGIVEEPVNIDGGAKWFRKKKHVTLDWSKFRPPQDANVVKKR